MDKFAIPNPLIKVINLKKDFIQHSFLNSIRIVKTKIIAVDNVSFEIQPGETMGLVGESGCGKSTLGKLLIRLLKPDSGEILFNGINIASLNKNELRPFRKDLQIVFQNPYSSLNNKLTVKEILSGGLRLHKICSRSEENDIIKFLLELVGLKGNDMYKHPYEFSGGQCQRIDIARSISIEPKFIVCDESISALDVLSQTQIITMLKELQSKMNISYLFISHNINAVKQISNTMAVMLKGKLVEVGPTHEVYFHSMHPYTKQLIKSSIYTSPKSRSVGRISNYIVLPENSHTSQTGCIFFDQCNNRIENLCKNHPPQLQSIDATHHVACHLFNK